MIEASSEAQGLALLAAHFGLDPYETWNRGLLDLPPHPRPREYRALLYAMALWYEKRLTDRDDALPIRFGKVFFGVKDERPEKRERGMRHAGARRS